MTITITVGVPIEEYYNFDSHEIYSVLKFGYDHHLWMCENNVEVIIPEIGRKVNQTFRVKEEMANEIKKWANYYDLSILDMGYVLIRGFNN